MCNKNLRITPRTDFFETILWKFFWFFTENFWKKKKFWVSEFWFFGLKIEFKWHLQLYLGFDFQRLLEGQKFYFWKFFFFSCFWHLIFWLILDLSLAGIGTCLRYGGGKLEGPPTSQNHPVRGQGLPWGMLGVLDKFDFFCQKVEKGETENSSMRHYDP